LRVIQAKPTLFEEMQTLHCLVADLTAIEM
jgi:hypothetical protein